MARRIVDSHHHLFDVDGHAPGWLALDPPPDQLQRILGADIRPIQRSYLPPDYVADMPPAVVKSVCVDPNGAVEEAAGETAWLQSLADVHGFPHGIVAGAALEEPGVGELLEEHCRHANTRGIRQLLNAHDDPDWNFARGDLMESPDWRRGYGLLARHGLSFDLQCYPHQLAGAAELLAAYPDVPVILDHFGMPIERDEAGLERWRSALAVIAALPNVVVKLSGFTQIARGWSLDAVRPLVAGTIEAFGVERCLFASNFPVERLYVDAATLIGDLETVFGELGLSESERDAIFHGNAVRTYRL